MASPLIAGNDLAKATDTDIGILTNKDVIAVNQDPLGEQGRIIRTNDDGSEVLRRQLANGDVAVVLFNPTESTRSMKVDIRELGKARGQRHKVKDLWSGETVMVKSSIQAEVPSHGVAMYTVTLKGSHKHR